MRYWIAQGQLRAGAPCGDDVLAAFDALDAALADPRFSTSHQLREAETLFVNNERFVYGRLLWRIWLDEQVTAERRATART